MSFEKEIQETIQKALREREKDEISRKEFSSSWEKKRREILSTLEDAASAMRAILDLRDCEACRDNGGVILRVKHAEDKTSSELRFEPNRKDRKIRVSSSVDDSETEEYKLEDIVVEVIKNKVRSFVYTVARGAKGEGDEWYSF